MNVCCAQHGNDFKNVVGVWMDKQYYDRLKNPDDTNVTSIMPRLAYIDKNGKLLIENHIEYLQKRKIPKRIINKNLIDYVGLRLSVVDSNTINFLYGGTKHRSLFTRISKTYCAGCGMQLYFTNYYFENEPHWKLINEDSKSHNTIKVKIRHGEMLKQNNRDTLTDFLFDEKPGKSASGKRHYQLYFYNARNKILLEATPLEIKKRNVDTVLLYHDGVLKYTLLKDSSR
jgi:hypothetical protein